MENNSICDAHFLVFILLPIISRWNCFYWEIKMLIVKPVKRYMAVSQFPADNQMTIFSDAYNKLQETKVANKKISCRVTWHRKCDCSQQCIDIYWLSHQMCSNNLSNGLETRMISMQWFGLKSNFLLRKVIFEVSLWILISLLEDILKQISVLPETKEAI